MPLLRVDDVSLSFGPQVVLDHASLQLFKGQRVCLVGRNGAGKSTFMKLIADEIKPDTGTLWRRPGVVISRLEQELPAADALTVFQVVAGGLREVGDLLAAYDQLVASAMDAQHLKQLERVQHDLDARDGWRFQQRIDEVLTRLSLPKQAPMASLSGGWRRRVVLAKALVADPDILLLDEPTNHLDIESIQWLENQLMEFSGAVLFISHDRALVRRLATRIAELDRGILREYRCGYDHFLEEREHLLQVEAQHNALFDKKLAQEEVWIRQGIKARRTRNEGRVRALEKLREQRGQRRTLSGTASFGVDAGSSSGKLVVEANTIGFTIDDKTLFDNLSFNIMRGDKIGLLGPNGVGKTTLLKVLLGQLQPTRGSVKLGTNLQIAYFDQMREQLDGDKTIVDTVGHGRESVEINGREKHILSYLADFLFTPERARTPLKALSGGERNRVQLALLFSQPANLLVMDEPTNDLDMETLELLESILVDYPGTVLLVSHDRDFMDNVVTSTLAFEGQGVVREYVGGYRDWIRQGGRFSTDSEAGSDDKQKPGKKTGGQKNESSTTVGEQPAAKPRKLSFKDQRELEELPKRIEQLEAEQAALQAALQVKTASADFYQGDHSQVNGTLEQLAAVSAELESCYQRWLELSE